MQFLKILLWVLAAFGAAMFTLSNAISVPINLWGGLVAEVNLPFLLLATFLAGMVPTWAYFRTVRWRLTQRLAATERVIADLKPTVPVGSVAASPQPQPLTPSPSPGAENRPAMPIGAAQPAPSAPDATPPEPTPDSPTEPFTLTP